MSQAFRCSSLSSSAWWRKKAAKHLLEHVLAVLDVAGAGQGQPPHHVPPAFHLGAGGSVVGHFPHHPSGIQGRRGPLPAHAPGREDRPSSVTYHTMKQAGRLRGKKIFIVFSREKALGNIKEA